MDSAFQFYQQIPTFSKFEDLTLNQHYQNLPGDWWVFLTDIENSTVAIENGNYKSVNMVGAASITVCQNALGGQEFPYVFGGDGASLCLPPQAVDVVEEALGRLQYHSKENFDLKLRVAKIPLSDILKSQKQIRVAKYEMTPGRSIALFQGGGLGYADELAKKKYELYKTAPVADAPNLDGLSCRWNPVPSRNGIILSLLVVSQNPDDMEQYQAVLMELQKILEHGIEEANPIGGKNMSYRPLLENLRTELRGLLARGFPQVVRQVREVMLSFTLFKLGFLKFFSAVDSYRRSIRQHSDFRKFDDTLRMVIDCSPEQTRNILEFLEKMYGMGIIFYGTHQSNEALMTCFVDNIQDGGHIHFVDGANGGYAMAAKQLKKQIALKG